MAVRTSLRYVVSQLESLGEKQGVSRHLCRWILCTPKKTGAAKLTLQSKVLDPLFILLSTRERPP